MPKLGLLHQIEKDFGSFTNFREKFIEAALTLFGSGWVWLVCKSISYWYFLSKLMHFLFMIHKCFLSHKLLEHLYILFLV